MDANEEEAARCRDPFDEWLENRTEQMHQDLILAWRLDMRDSLKRYGAVHAWANATSLARALAPRGERTPSWLMVREVLAVDALFAFLDRCRA